jgi:hypothetical protein
MIRLVASHVALAVLASGIAAAYIVGFAAQRVIEKIAKEKRV